MNIYGEFQEKLCLFRNYLLGEERSAATIENMEGMSWPSYHGCLTVKRFQKKWWLDISRQSSGNTKQQAPTACWYL